MPPLQTPKIGVAGALGRMGAAVGRALGEQSDLQLAAAFDRPGSAGQIALGLTLCAMDEALAACDVIIDFSSPASSLALAEAAAARGAPALVIASTGFSEAETQAVAAAAAKVAIVKSGNVSLGVNLLLGLVRQAAAALGPQDWDIEVFEAHHRRKVDAPSGTALMLGEAAAAGRGVCLAETAVRARDGLTGPRRAGDIGFSVMRGGGVVGEHSVAFAAEAEIITLSHSARDRSLFAKGALAAAAWVAGREPGLYSMQDVLGFTEGSTKR
jgi:4-hydroxy-tetrahydrodipicolinate reductase